MRFDGFDWDEGNWQKCQKHGVQVDEIEGLFEDTVSVSPDPTHSIQEERFKVLGCTKAGRALLVIFTLRTNGEMFLIRSVSARYMHRKEVDWYEEASDSDE